MGELVNNGSIIVAILVIFMSGFVFKVIYSICYNAVLDKIECKNFRQSKIVNMIVENYESDNSDKKAIKNTEAYVRSKLNQWKECGIYVERMNDYGNVASGLCIIIGTIVDMYLISNYDSGNLSTSETVIKVAVYSLVPAICMMITKLWDYAVGIEYKKKMIFEEIINYIDNRTIYVTLNTDDKAVEALINDENVSENKKSKETQEKQQKEINGEIQAVNDEGKKAGNGCVEQNQSDKSVERELEENEKVEVISQVLNEFL